MLTGLTCVALTIVVFDVVLLLLFDVAVELVVVLLVEKSCCDENIGMGAVLAPFTTWLMLLLSFPLSDVRILLALFPELFVVLFPLLLLLFPSVEEEAPPPPPPPPNAFELMSAASFSLSFEDDL